MRIEVIGCGEAFDSGLGNNSCLLKAGGAPLILIDCGYQIPERLWSRPDYRKIGAIYLSHIHADHAFGIVPLLTRYFLEERTLPITVLGHSGLEAYVKRAMQVGYPGLWEKLTFPIEFQVLRPKHTVHWNGLSIDVAPSIHSVKNYAVRFQRKSGGASFCFSGDGAISPETKNLYQGCELLLHEAYTWSKEIPGHTSVKKVLDELANSNISKIVLTHHWSKEKEKIRKKVQSSLGDMRNVESAMPGQIFTI